MPIVAEVLLPLFEKFADEVRAFLAPSFPKYRLPDAFEVRGEIPRSSAGKFEKAALRELSERLT